MLMMNPYAAWLTQAEFDALPVSERMLLIGAYYADRVKVLEIGTNGGYYVELFLRFCGLGRGNPWCAAFVAYCLHLAGWTHIPAQPAAVISWYRLRNVTKPQRGDLFCWLNPGGTTGHMGMVTRVLGPMMWTIEGNTQSGNAGDQRDGDGLYRRVRLTAGKHFIRIGAVQ